MPSFQSIQELIDTLWKKVPGVWVRYIDIPFQNSYSSQQEIVLIGDRIDFPGLLPQIASILGKPLHVLPFETWRVPVKNSIIPITLTDFEDSKTNQKIALHVASVSLPPTIQDPESHILFPWKVGQRENNLIKEKSPSSSEYKHLQGIRNFKRFVATLYLLTKIEKTHFDVIVGSGNSGISMTYFAERIFNLLNVPLPQVLTIPLIRVADKTKTTWTRERSYTNLSQVQELVNERLKSNRNIKNILFVDEEVGYGVTALTAVDLIGKASNIPADQIKAIIVAENYGDRITPTDYQFSVRFAPISIGRKGQDCTIFHILTEKQQELLSEEKTGKTFNIKEKANVYLGLPLKAVVDDIPTFSMETTNRISHSIPRFCNVQKSFRETIDLLIKQAIDEAETIADTTFH